MAYKLGFLYFFPVLGDIAFKNSNLYDFFLYKQKWLFYQEDGYLWPYCCMNDLLISYRSRNAQTYSF